MTIERGPLALTLGLALVPIVGLGAVIWAKLPKQQHPIAQTATPVAAVVPTLPESPPQPKPPEISPDAMTVLKFAVDYPEFHDFVSDYSKKPREFEPQSAKDGQIGFLPSVRVMRIYNERAATVWFGETVLLRKVDTAAMIPGREFDPKGYVFRCQVMSEKTDNQIEKIVVFDAVPLANFESAREAHRRLSRPDHPRDPPRHDPFAP